jgi:hypothetical protein
MAGSLLQHAQGYLVMAVLTNKLAMLDQIAWDVPDMLTLGWRLGLLSDQFQSLAAEALEDARKFGDIARKMVEDHVELLAGLIEDNRKQVAATLEKWRAEQDAEGEEWKQGADPEDAPP